MFSYNWIILAIIHLNYGHKTEIIADLVEIRRYLRRCQHQYCTLSEINMLFGSKIRELRDEQGVLQRQLTVLLELDTPMFSKIERGDRRAKREQVTKLAEYLHQDEKEMLTLWLADKVLDAVDGEEELSNDAITVAQEQIQR